MAYTIDLTLIMQNLFWMVEIHNMPVSRRLVKFAFATYQKSRVKTQVHIDIKKYADGTNILDRVNRDGVIGKIFGLIDAYRIHPAEMFEQRNVFAGFDVNDKGDEPWDE
jgi:hypothetical protein